MKSSDVYLIQENAPNQPSHWGVGNLDRAPHGRVISAANSPQHAREIIRQLRCKQPDASIYGYSILRIRHNSLTYGLHSDRVVPYEYYMADSMRPVRVSVEPLGMDEDHFGVHDLLFEVQAESAGPHEEF